MSKKVAFIIPPFVGGRYFLQPPLGSLWTIALLKKENIKSDLYDLRLEKNYESIFERVKNNYEYLVFCTSELDILQNYPVDYRLQYALSLCKKIKESTTAKVIVVGAHGSVLPKLILKDTGVDYVVSGEWELATSNFIKSKKPIKSKIIQGIKGLMNENIIPDFSLIDFKKYYGYSIKSNENKLLYNWSVVQGSRGCPFSCNFCYNFYGNNMSYRNSKTIYKDIQNQVNRGAKRIFFIDSIFGLDKKNTVELCNLLIKSPLNVDLIVQTRAGLLDFDTLCLMKKAGFIGVWYGIESFDDTVLKASEKNNSAQKNLDAIKITERAGLIPAAFMMQGLPNQKAEVVSRDLDKLLSMGIRFNLSTLLIRPGSQLYLEKIGDVSKVARPWHLPLLLKGESLFGDKPEDMIKVYRKYYRKRAKNKCLQKNKTTALCAIIIDKHKNYFDECYEIINFVEEQKKHYRNITLHLFCNNFFDHPFVEEIIKYLNDSGISVLIVTSFKNAHIHKAILSTIKGNLTFTSYEETEKFESDYNLMLHLQLMSNKKITIEKDFLKIIKVKKIYNKYIYLGE